MPGALAGTIRRLLLSGPGSDATRELRNRLANGSEFSTAIAEEYKGLDELLRDYPGFDN